MGTWKFVPLAKEWHSDSPDSTLAADGRKIFNFESNKGSSARMPLIICETWQKGDVESVSIETMTHVDC